jgi:putative oxidoreductase
VAASPAALLTRVLATGNDYGALIARVALGLVILPHGLQKTLGWYGGGGFEGTMGFFTTQMGIPSAFALLAILAESVGALALILGLLGRVSALGVGITMAVAALLVHAPNGFFMNWFGAQAGEGMEFFLLAVALAAITLVKGSGALSLDRVLAKRLSR